MRLDRAHIQIRPRSHLDVLDLAVALVRTRWLGLGICAALGVAPFLALNLYVFTPDYFDHSDFVGLVFTYFLFLVLEVPWATSLISLYLGQATFMPRVSKRAIALDFLRSLGQLFFYQFMIRGLCVVIIVLLPLVALGFKYLNEIILLERANWMRTWSRRSSFHSRLLGKIFGESLFDLFVGGLMTILLMNALISITDLWADRWSWSWSDFASTDLVWQLVEPIFRWEGQVALWLVLCFFTVARFLSYLDCRIRREGWDVELKMKIQAARLPKEAP